MHAYTTYRCSKLDDSLNSLPQSAGREENWSAKPRVIAATAITAEAG